MPTYYCPGRITKQSWNMRTDLHESKLDNALEEYIHTAITNEYSVHTMRLGIVQRKAFLNFGM